MDLNIPSEMEQFRMEMRAFIREAIPEAMAQREREGWQPSEQDLREWMRILSEKGWSQPDWPTEYGGAGWTPLQSYIFEDECAAANAPHISWRAGSSLVGPVLYTFGSEAHKSYYLPRIRVGQDIWCQGFSEPNAGSDLASLRTTAIADENDYIVNGQKIWTSDAHIADWMLALVRTDPEAKPQQGISCIIIDMKTPGITVRPITTIDDCKHVNEVFFDNVRIPAENLVGEINKGWTYAKFLLGNERHSNALIQRIKREITKLRELAVDESYGAIFMTKPSFRHALAQLEIDTNALEWAVLRAACTHGAVGARDLAFASGLKIAGSELQQRVADLQMDIVGPWVRPSFAEPHQGPWDSASPRGSAPDTVPGIASKALFRRASTIYGGANEIQRSIIWRSAFNQ